MNKALVSLIAIILLLSLLYGCAPVTAAPTPLAAPSTETPIPSNLLPVRGLYVQFERRGWASGYFSGDVINGFNNFDEVVGHTVAQEVSLQLDQMAQMGVNTIGFELRSSDPVYIPGPFSPPECNLPPSLGLQYPRPGEEASQNIESPYIFMGCMVLHCASLASTRYSRYISLLD